MNQFKDVLSLQDLPCETRVFLALRRKQIELRAKVAAHNLLKNPLIRAAVVEEVRT